VSDNCKISREQRHIAVVRSIKADTDVLYTQLRSGVCSSPDTFANNRAHLIRAVNDIKPVLSEPGVMETLLQTDVLIYADLLAMTRSVEIIENFLACLEHQGSKDEIRSRLKLT